MRVDDFSAGPGVEEDSAEDSEVRRERSTIEFPYMDLEHALTVAQAVFDRNGRAECRHDELAVQLGLSPSSSGFRTRVAAARIFGLIHSERGSEFVKLTNLGLRAIDESTTRRAKVEAFLEVDLFRKVYEHYSGVPLPPTAALQRELQGFGVAAKQVERARQIMERSASLAGFFESGRDRLVKPARLDAEAAEGETATARAAPKESRTSDLRHRFSGGAGGGSNDGLGQIIQGLLATLPQSGSVWPEQKREQWLGVLRESFRLFYREADEGDSKAKDDAEEAFE